MCGYSYYLPLTSYFFFARSDKECNGLIGLLIVT